MVPDAIGEWWIHPLATALPAEERTVFGAIASNGSILACQFDHATGETLRVPIASAPPDDHNVPALWAAPGRRMVAMWTHHSHEQFIHCKVSDVAGNLTSLVSAPDQVTPTQANTTSYTQIYHLPHDSTPTVDSFIVFSRMSAQWSVIPFTVDQTTGDVTWGTTVDLTTSSGQSYLTTAVHYDAGTGQHVIRAAWGYNPAQPVHAIRYVEIDAITGDVTSPVDAAVTGNIYTGAGLPLIDTDVTPLVEEPAAGMSRRLFYVRPGPMSPGVAYADWDETDPDAAVYRTTVQNGTQWVTRSHGIAGPRIGYTAAANYIGGMSFPSPCTTDTVYVARQELNIATIERQTITAGGTITELLVQDSSRRWIRPTAPVDDAVGVIAFEVVHYGTSYTDYEANAHYLSEPIDPSALTTVDRAIRILAGELRTGRILGEIPVSAASWEMVHRAAGTISAEIPLGSPDLADRARDLVPMLEGTRCYLAAVVGNEVLEAGPIWSHGWDPVSGVLSVVAKGLWSLWDHRAVMAALAPTPSNPNPWKTWSVTYDGLSLGTQAKRLIQLTLARAGGYVPVVLPGDVSGSHERTWYGYQVGLVGERVQQLMEVQGGPDIAFPPRRTSDGLSIEWVMRVGNPILKQAGDEWRWNADAPRSSVQSATITRDWSALASHIWATGSGQEESLLIRQARDTSLTDAGFPLLETSTSYPTVQRGTTLQSHADSDLAYASRPWMTLGITVRADEDPELGQYRPGDYARLWPLQNDPYLQALGITGRDFRSRLMRISGNLGPEVTLTLAPTREAS